MATILPAGEHYGTISSQWSSEAFNINHVQYESGSKYALHGNERASLLFTLDGDCTKKMGGKELLCVSNSMVFIPPQRLQADTYSATTTFLAIELAPSFFTGTQRRYAAPQTEIVLSSPQSVALGIQLADEFKHVDLVSALVFEGLLLNILAAAHREYTVAPGPRPPSWLQRAKEMLRDSASQSPSMRTIAREVGVHPVHLCREFRRFFKTAPGEYLRRVRVETAARLLREQDLPLSEIAMISGFADQAHFSRTFRRVMKLSPLQYRRARSQMM